MYVCYVLFNKWMLNYYQPYNFRVSETVTYMLVTKFQLYSQKCNVCSYLKFVKVSELAICYVLPVLWSLRWRQICIRIGRNRRHEKGVCSTQLARWHHGFDSGVYLDWLTRGQRRTAAEFDVCDCVLMQCDILLQAQAALVDKRLM